MKCKILWQLSIALLAVSCSKSIDPLPDKNTNWLRPCRTDAMCGDGLECLCGLCTESCAENRECGTGDNELTCKGVESPVLSARCAGSETGDVAAVCVATCIGKSDCTSFGNAAVCSAGLCLRSEPEETQVVGSDAGRDASADDSHDTATPADAGDVVSIPSDAGHDAAIASDAGDLSLDSDVAQPPDHECPSLGEPLAVAVTSAVWEQQTVRLQLRANDPAVAELVHLSTVYGPDADRYPVEAASDPFATRIDQLSHGPWPDEFDVYFAFFCGPESDRIGYQVRVRLHTSLPADSGDVPYEIIPNPDEEPDAGGDN